jgi:hypothetical protein
MICKELGWLIQYDWAGQLRNFSAICGREYQIFLLSKASSMVLALFFQGWSSQGVRLTTYLHAVPA